MIRKEPSIITPDIDSFQLKNALNDITDVIMHGKVKNYK